MEHHNEIAARKKVNVDRFISISSKSSKKELGIMFTRMNVEIIGWKKDDNNAI